MRVLVDARYDDNYMTVSNGSPPMYDAIPPSESCLSWCPSDWWNLSRVQIVGLVTNSFA